MTTAFGTSPRISGSGFFPMPPRPVCRFSRADLDRMHRDRVAPQRKRLMPVRKGLAGAARIAWIDRYIAHNDEPVTLDCPAADAQALRSAAAMFGLSLADLLAGQKTRLVVAARRYAAVRLHALGRDPSEIARLLRRKRETILYHLGLKIITRRRG